MKSRWILLTTVVALYGCGGQTSQNAIQTKTMTETELTSEAAPKEILTGGYSPQREIKTHEEQPFDVLTSKIDSVEYVAKSVATQIVSGTNYKYICKATPRSGAEPYLVELVIYLPLPNSGKEARITHINRCEK